MGDPIFRAAKGLPDLVPDLQVQRQDVSGVPARRWVVCVVADRANERIADRITLDWCQIFRRAAGNTDQNDTADQTFGYEGLHIVTY